MNVSEFLDVINEKSWRNNIKNETSRKLDAMIEYIEKNRALILEEVADSMNRIEEVKVEDEEIFGYSDAQKWIEKYIKESIIGLL